MSFWRERALCLNSTPGIFFPPDSFEPSKRRKQREERARYICKACTVRDECLTYAIKNQEPEGVWGGMNEKERAHHKTLLQNSSVS